MYVDGYVLAVPAANKEQYRDLATKAAHVFKKNGALRVVEAWEDDVPEGKITSFPLAVKRNADEKVVFSWVLWSSRQTRDEGMKNAMEELQKMMPEQPNLFDGKRMVFGGFEALVDLQ